MRLSRFRPGTRQSGQRAQLLYSFMEQKVRVELTNERFAVSYSADEHLPHIMEEGVRFELTDGSAPSTVFKTVPINQTPATLHTTRQFIEINLILSQTR